MLEIEIKLIAITEIPNWQRPIYRVFNTIVNFWNLCVLSSAFWLPVLTLLVYMFPFLDRKSCYNSFLNFVITNENKKIDLYLHTLYAVFI